MEHKERVALYLSELADRNTILQFENDLPDDPSLLERFVESCEKIIRLAPPGFADMVMGNIESSRLPPVPKVPVLSRRLCAAVCFSSAAAIALMAFTGYEQHVFDFLSNHSGNLYKVVSAFIT